MKYPVLLIATLVTLSGCMPYPRYRNQPDNTPVEMGPRLNRLRTDDYIRLGQILQSYLGRPYGDRDARGLGLDCSLFTQEVYRRFYKSQLPRTAEEQFHSGEPVATRRLEFGDLLFFRTERDKISHVGIYVGYNEFIHTSSSQGVIISGFGEEYWAKRYAGARRIVEQQG
jgi:cell wall-associated NlpC family hydrolase